MDFEGMKNQLGTKVYTASVIRLEIYTPECEWLLVHRYGSFCV